MKRLSILLLCVLIAMMAGDIVSAKGKRHTASSKSGIPSASVVMKMELDNPDKVKALTGLDLLYKNLNDLPGSEDENTSYERAEYYYGKDAKIIQNGDIITVIGTGPHAFYYSYEHYITDVNEWMYEFGFKNKADREKFYKQLKKLGYDSDVLYKSHSNGWYTITIDCA